MQKIFIKYYHYLRGLFKWERGGNDPKNRFFAKKGPHPLIRGGQPDAIDPESRFFAKKDPNTLSRGGQAEAIDPKSQFFAKKDQKKSIFSGLVSGASAPKNKTP